MKSLTAFALALFCAVNFAHAQSSTVINVGGTVINLPIPEGLVDGATLSPGLPQRISKLMVDPIVIRAIFLDLRDVEKHLDGEQSKVDHPYFSLATITQGDLLKLTQQHFNGFKASIIAEQKKLGDYADESLSEIMQSANELRHDAEIPYQIAAGKPIPLGVIDHSPRSIIVSMQVPMEIEGDANKLGFISSVAYVLVKDKMVLLTRYMNYSSEPNLDASVKDLKRAVDAMLAANTQ